MNERIGFVGVGRMGANMARRLNDCGYRVTAVRDQALPAAGDLATEICAQAMESLATVTAAADVVFTVVTNDAAQLSLFSESGDSLLIGARGKIFVNCATLRPDTHVEVARRVGQVGAGLLEGCMASSIPQARNGSLYLMCADDRGAFEKVRPILEKLSTAPRYIGETGRAAHVKALVNMVMNINTGALAEGLGLGAALGLDLEMLREVFAQTGANSQVLKTDGEDMQNRAHECYFSAEHAAKDSSIAWEMACKAGVHAPLAAATKLQYDRMVALELGALDKSGIAELTFKGRHG